MDTIKVSRRTLPPLRTWGYVAVWFQDGLTTARDERTAKEALVMAVVEMNGDVSKLGPNWGNMEAPLKEWRASNDGVLAVDENGLPTSVRLRYCSLSGPMLPQLCRLTTLVTLDLSINHITTLPNCIDKLTNLTKLNLYKNQLTTLPDSIGNLTSLMILELTRNQLTVLPDSIGNLTNLIHLHMYSNQLTILPDSIGNLTNLTWLNLCFNRITILPDSIGNLVSLKQLLLQCNHLTRLPNSIENLTSVELILLHNRFPNDEVQRIHYTVGRQNRVSL